MKASHFSRDVQEFLFLLDKHQVRYLIVGGEAVIYYGYARLTGDVDFLFESTAENVQRVYECLNEFWVGNIPGLKEMGELEKEGIIIQFGVPPNRIDLLNSIDGVSFKEAWHHRETGQIEIKGMEVPVYYIGLEELIRNKELVSRNKDQEDLQYLRQALQERKR